MVNKIFWSVIIILVALAGFFSANYYLLSTKKTKVVSPNENFRNLNLVAGQKISSPLKISGEVRGNWFFEASFPVFVVDWDGRIIAQGVAQAKSSWMTTDFVPFEATLQFTKPAYGKNGAIILKKDNPSGLPANDAAYEIPVVFE